MAEMDVLQANAFLRAYKKLNNSQKDAVDQAVAEIIRDPTLGEAKRSFHCIDRSRPMNCHAAVEFEWDETKSNACYEQRGFDFAYVLRVFLDPDRVIRRDHRWDYGEDRFQLTGAIDERV